MTVSDLIGRLSKYDAGARVVLRCEDGGFYDVHAIEEVDLHLDVNQFAGAGPHDLAHSADLEIVSCVLIEPSKAEMAVAEATTSQRHF